MVVLVGRDRGPGAVLSNLLMCLGDNQGIGSGMSGGFWGTPWWGVMMRGTRPPGITDSVEYCGTELDEDWGAVVSEGIPVEITESYGWVSVNIVLVFIMLVRVGERLIRDHWAWWGLPDCVQRGVVYAGHCGCRLPVVGVVGWVTADVQLAYVISVRHDSHHTSWLCWPVMLFILAHVHAIQSCEPVRRGNQACYVVVHCFSLQSVAVHLFYKHHLAGWGLRDCGGWVVHLHWENAIFRISELLVTRTSL